jgi:hypothetical protein
MSHDLTRPDHRSLTTRPLGTPWLRGMAIVAGAAVLVACGGGGDDSDATDPTALTTTTAATTSTPVPVTTASIAPPTTEPPVSDPPPTETPPTTFDAAALEDQIRADFELSYRSYLECVFEPASCAFENVNEPGSPLDAALRRTVDEFLTNGLKARRDSGLIYYEIREIEKIDDGEFRLEACMVDGGVVYEEGDPATTADDIIWNDSLSSTVSSWTLRETEIGWRLHSVAQLAVYPEVEGCDDLG